MTDKQMQCLLACLDYDPGPIDGIAGARTKAALEAFCRDYGVGAEGLMDAAAGAVAKSGSFWDNSRYFTRDEFRCPCGKCGGFPVEPQEALVRLVNDIREELGRPVVIVPPDGHSGGSGVRCADYNRKVGGVANSYHLLGKAADLCIPGVSRAATEAVLAKYRNRIHYWYAITSGSYHVDVE